ncbi:kinase-like domain-containing protein [Flammula alnicola]|nr:kinase-like domain-containing protein [Flammula alnicola]
MLSPRDLSEKGLRMDSFSLDSDGTVEAASGSTTFLYQSDDERYDTGFFIIVYYSKNAAEANCVENEALEAEDSLDLMIFRNKVLPSIDKLLPVTNIDLKTVNGSVLISPRDSPNDKIYPLIPDSLATVPRVSISLLRKCPMQTSHFHLDLVTIAGHSNDSWYAFKRYRIPIDHEDQPMGILLTEVEHLNSLRSQHIIRPAFLVADNLNSECFRGYLTPFLPAGTLTDVFDDLLGDGTLDPMDPVVQDAVLLRPKLSQPSSRKANTSCEDAAGKPFVSKLSWPLKHTWSIEATSGVVALHDNRTCSGDIKLDNILLGRDGQLQLIDVAPQEGYTERYMPPEFDLVQIGDELPKTEARDVFALGIVLWQIAEEVGRFDREDPLTSPCLVWEEGQGSTPQWYRDLVNSCVEEDPGERPTARQILKVLRAGQ